jgi:hypothetical protein
MTKRTKTTEKTHAEYSRDGWGGRGSLSRLVAELERQKATKIDFVADVRDLGASVHVQENEPGRKSESINTLRMVPKSPAMGEFIDKTGIEFTDSAFSQLLQKSEPAIPVRYGRSLLAENGIAASNLTEETFFGSGRRRLFRCLDGVVRSVLSDSYRFVDHFDLAFTALEEVQARDGEVIEATLDDHRMRLKFTSRSIFEVLDATREGSDRSKWYAGGIGSKEHLRKVGANAGDALPGGPGTIHPSVVLSNSETGHGGINVRLGILHGICFNLATVESIVSDIHLGGTLDGGIFTDETRAADSKVIFLKTRDAIRTAFEPERFKRLVDKLRRSAEVEILAPSSAVGLVAERLELDQERRDAILGHFVADYAQTALGLASAVTRAAQDVDHPEVAEEWEQFAGEILAAPERTLAGSLG